MFYIYNVPLALNLLPGKYNTHAEGSKNEQGE